VLARLGPGLWFGEMALLQSAASTPWWPGNKPAREPVSRVNHRQPDRASGSVWADEGKIQGGHRRRI